jgi:hypothetical protein
MKNAISIIAGVIAFVLFVLAYPTIYEYFGTRYANASREIFENSKPFLHGQIENLTRMQLEYRLAANEGHRDAIRSMVLTQTATMDKTKLPYELQTWIKSL